ncbi:helix-turn-helix transcriptional regulator [Streptomyces sp. H27-H1]|uniref:helix-turn-helix domain-containing protein n=1 Tax=Streptomyces sp. H27-H1 TaxID=2996461 RepID=UPI00226DF2D0|nr:helix-turn-helix transcriptional regulator [Streptomyces sp. H27-H1]MCY0928890.1 helix-turn-helix transcriptional regulator [Streptomyces sp. H27-H1]
MCWLPHRWPGGAPAPRFARWHADGRHRCRRRAPAAADGRRQRLEGGTERLALGGTARATRTPPRDGGPARQPSVARTRALPEPVERRRLREAWKLTPSQVASAVGVTAATVRSWETGHSAPTGKRREACARFLHGLAQEPQRHCPPTARPQEMGSGGHRGPHGPP